MEQKLQAGKLYRHVNSLIVAHLRDNNLNQAASAVASATMTPMNVQAPRNKLLELVAKGLAVDKDEAVREVSTAVPFDPIITAAYGSIPAPRAACVDFRQFISHHTVFFYLKGLKVRFYKLSVEVQSMLRRLTKSLKSLSHADVCS